MVFECIFLTRAICPFLLSIWPDTNRGAQEFRDSNWKYCSLVFVFIRSPRPIFYLAFGFRSNIISAKAWVLPVRANLGEPDSTPTNPDQSGPP